MCVHMLSDSYVCVDGCLLEGMVIVALLLLLSMFRGSTYGGVDVPIILLLVLLVVIYNNRRRINL